MMAGDGLNIVALLQSDAGLVLSESVNHFTPGCDALMDGSQFLKLPDRLRLSKSAIAIITTGFVIALTYNVFAAGVVAMGNLSPVFAAILMPISTTSLVAFTAGCATLTFRKRWKG